MLHAAVSVAPASTCCKAALHVWQQLTENNRTSGTYGHLQQHILHATFQNYDCQRAHQEECGISHHVAMSMLAIVTSAISPR